MYTIRPSACCGIVLSFLKCTRIRIGGKWQPRRVVTILDQWVLSRLGEVVEGATKAFDAYDLPEVCRLVRVFVDDYSTWYVRRSRERVRGVDEKDKQFSLATQHRVLLVIAKIMAPITPFLAESIYRGIRGTGESVHLEAWPEKIAVKRALVAHMETVRHIVSLALEARSKNAIKVRQPLAELRIGDGDMLKRKELLALIAEEVNVKRVVFKAGDGVELDTVISEELRREGLVREIMREIQDKRKELGFEPKDTIVVEIATSNAFLKDFASEIARVVHASSVRVVASSAADSIVVKKV